MPRDGSHFLPRSPERFILVQRPRVSGPRHRRPPSSVIAAAATMSEKKTAEKVSEIDAHISKQYDIVKRLGKGVSYFFFFSSVSLFLLFVSFFSFFFSRLRGNLRMMRVWSRICIIYYQ